MNCFFTYNTGSAKVIFHSANIFKKLSQVFLFLVLEFGYFVTWFQSPPLLYLLLVFSCSAVIFVSPQVVILRNISFFPGCSQHHNFSFKRIVIFYIFICYIQKFCICLYFSNCYFYYKFYCKKFIYSGFLVIFLCFI